MPAPWIATMGQQAAEQGVAAGMGLILGGINDRRQIKQQKKLQAMQIEGNKQLTDYNQKKALEMWEATNYGPQIAQMRKAGINPALMYGGTGAGGSTQVVQGNVGSGNAPTGGREAQDMMGMGIQLRLLQAQKENIEANTAKTKAEAEKTAGVDTTLGETQIKSLTQGIENAKAAKELTEVQTKISKLEERVKGDTINDAIELIIYTNERLKQEVENISRTNEIGEATKQNLIKKVEGEMIGVFLQNALTQAQTGKTKADTQLSETERKAVITRLVQGWEQISIGLQNTTVNEKKQRMDEWLHDVQESTKLGMDVIEKAIQGITLKNIIGKQKSTREIAEDLERHYNR